MTKKKNPDPMHRLYYGDCLAMMRLWMKDDTVDLVYLDPPWQPKRASNVLHRERDGSESEASVEAFNRTWRWSNATWLAAEAIMAVGGELAAAIDGFRRRYGETNTFAYLVRMGAVLTEVHRVMKPGASMYLHCDQRFNAPLRMLADAVFVNGLQSEIIRMFRGMPSGAKRYRRAHETLYHYCKGESPTTFHMEYERPARSTMKRMNGQRQHLAPGSTRKERRDEPARPPLRDTWYFGILADKSPEKMRGFDTQKPLRLLKRIINVSSNPGDLVLDPFCGSGVTLYASHLLGRRSSCMDNNHLAIDRICERLATYPEYHGVEPHVAGDPIDVAGARKLAATNKHAFQDWVGRQLGASGVHEHGGDSGIDDRVRFRDGGEVHLVVISVKGGDTGPGDVRDLMGVVARRKAAIGVFVTLDDPTPKMISEAADGYWTAHDKRRYPKIQFLSVDDLIAKRGITMPTSLAASDVPQNQRYHDNAVQYTLPI